MFIYLRGKFHFNKNALFISRFCMRDLRAVPWEPYLKKFAPPLPAMGLRSGQRRADVHWTSAHLLPG